jgi:hypothetical protein
MQKGPRLEKCLDYEHSADTDFLSLDQSRHNDEEFGTAFGQTCQSNATILIEAKILSTLHIKVRIIRSS